MRKSKLITRLAYIFIASALFSCSLRSSNKAVPPENIKLFLPEDVCNYPVNVTAKVFHGMGGGNWTQVSPDDPKAGYECSGALNLIQIYSPPGSSINVGYAAAGTERGSNTVTLEYAAAWTGPMDHESTYRTVYLNFLNDVLKQSLKQPMTDLMRKKITNLAGYFKGGKAEEEFFPLGDGFVILIRENDDTASSIKITTRIYPDIALKLDYANP